MKTAPVASRTEAVGQYEQALELLEAPSGGEKSLRAGEDEPAYVASSRHRQLAE